MLCTNHSRLRQTHSKVHWHQRVGRACLETLEDRRLMSFSPAVNCAIDASTDAIATADFNNDGNLDLVTCANADTGSFSVLLGNGAGGFGAAQRTVMGTQLSSIAVADFNNDTRPDMVVSDNGGFSILIGNGDGTFQSAVHTSGGEMATVGDFNNDSNIDVLVYWLDADWTTQVKVYCGNGQGGFGAGLDSQWGYYKMAAVDLNNDGNLDVATGDGVALLGDGNGSLQFGYGQPAPLTGGAIATGDFTGEGNADVIVAASSVAVLPGKGDGTFHAPILHTANGTSHTAVATADFNGDGKLDAVVTDRDTGTVSLMLGNGDGTLRYAGAFATGTYATGTYATGVVVGDFNRDGRPDVAVSTARNVSVLINDGDWSRPPSPLVSVNDAVAVTEGNTGTINATFTVSLSSASAVDVTVQYTTANLTALADGDYTAASGLVTIPAGQTSKTFTVAVTGDRLAEPAETFSVNLSAPTNATIGDGQGVGTILDDEPRVSIGDVSRLEGRKQRTTLFAFTVTLSAAYDQPVTTSFRTADGTARAGDGDYFARSGTITFNPGETSKTIAVEVRGDNSREGNETFFVDLFASSGNSLLTKARGVGTILNDD